MVSSFGQMVRSTSALGIMENNTAKAFIQHLGVNTKRENGLTGDESSGLLKHKFIINSVLEARVKACPI